MVVANWEEIALEQVEMVGGGARRGRIVLSKNQPRDVSVCKGLKLFRNKASGGFPCLCFRLCIICCTKGHGSVVKCRWQVDSRTG